MSDDIQDGQPPRLLPRTIEDVLRAWMVRGGGVALVAAVVIIWAAMLTWSANDPSLSLNTSEPAQNLLGLPGAMLADFFFHTLGISVIFFVLPPLVLGMQLALGDTTTDHRRRLALFALATIAIAGGCSALPVTQHWPSELGYGGIVGDFAYSLISGLLAGAAPKAAGPLAGLLYFAIGFWALSRAICLDRYNVFEIRLPVLAMLRRGIAKAGSKRTRQGTDDYSAASAGGVQQAHRVHDVGRYSPEPEPEAPEWTLDSRLHEYGDDTTPNAHTAPDREQDSQRAARRPTGSRQKSRIDDAWHNAPSRDQAEAGNWTDDEWPQPDEGVHLTGDDPNEASARHMASRLANGDGRDTAGKGDQAENSQQHNATPHEVVMLDDDAAAARDDIPNVLKRARQEAAAILPLEMARQILPAEPELRLVSDKPGKANASALRHAPDVQPADRALPNVPSEKALPKVVATGYRRPSLNLLKPQKSASPSADASPSVLQGRARLLEDVLGDFRIKGEITDVRPGPVVTLFELEPARGTKSSRIIALADDVARSMSAISARIAVVPGRNAIGIELPNSRRETFGLRELVDSQSFLDSTAKLPLVLGKGIAGEPVLTDLARMPHLLIAGTTGSGKSVGVNAMILSLIYRLGPQDCRFLMIDPKMLELSAYDGIPHLLTPVITDPQKAVTALSWAVAEMEERYKRMAELGVRSIDAFNNRVKHAARTGEKLGRTVQTGFDPVSGEAVFEKTALNAEPLPYIVIVVDEFADLMAVAGKQIEGLVQRLAQMARAAGIHMIMATQRPSVDVVTGTIKANFPTRISYRVASRIDSRTILNEQGGEQLLGQGDMLFLDGTGQVQRVHGPFVSDEEVEAVTKALRSTSAPKYVDILKGDSDKSQAAKAKRREKSADKYGKAV